MKLDIEIILKDLMYEIELETISLESTIEFIKSINDCYNLNKSLTEKQEKRIREVYERVMR